VVRRQYDRVALRVDEPSEFRVDAKTLAAELIPKDGTPAERATRADEILREAQGIFQQAEERAAGATTRATTLQEAIGIAGTLLITGAGLIVGQSALQGIGWVIAFAVLLFGATLALVMSGLRALAAASTIHVWYRPTARDIIKRSQLPEAVARTELAAETLIYYGYNTKVAAWKVAYLAASEGGTASPSLSSSPSPCSSASTRCSEPTTEPISVERRSCPSRASSVPGSVNRGREPCAPLSTLLGRRRSSQRRWALRSVKVEPATQLPMAALRGR
jgi:hypothetical protein